MQKFLAAKVEGCTYDPKHVLFEEKRSLYQFFFLVTSVPEDFHRLLDALCSKHAEHLRQNFSPDNFQSISEWTEALRKEIFDVLFPKADEPGERPALASLFQSAQIIPPDAFATEVALVQDSESLTPLPKWPCRTVGKMAWTGCQLKMSRFNFRSAVLDVWIVLRGTIDRAFRRLVQIKTAKKLLGSTADRQGALQPKR